MIENVITRNDNLKINTVNEIEFTFKDLILPALVDENNNFWFTIPTVGEFMGVRKDNRHKLADRLDDDEKGRIKITTLGGIQEVSVISESGLYLVTQRSNKKEIQDFQRWIRKDVLPSIRKYGIYILEERLNELEPKNLVEFLSEMNPEADLREIDGDLYISAKDIKDNLGLGSTKAIKYRLRENTHFKKYNRIIYINNTGLQIVIERSRKPEAMSIARNANLNVIKEVPEVSVKQYVLSTFKDVFEVQLNAPFQFEGETNYADILLPEFNLVLEVDEDNHQGYDKDREARREDHMRETCGWEVVRVDTHSDTYNHGEAINKLLLFIMSKSRNGS